MMQFWDDFIGRTARKEREAADRDLIKQVLHEATEAQKAQSAMIVEAIKSLAAVQQSQAQAIQTHLDLFKGPSGAPESVAPESDPERDGDMGEFPWGGTPEEQAAFINSHLDDD